MLKAGYAIKPSLLVEGVTLVNKESGVRYTVGAQLPVGFRQPKPRYELHRPAGGCYRATLGAIRQNCYLEVPA